MGSLETISRDNPQLDNVQDASAAQHVKEHQDSVAEDERNLK